MKNITLARLKGLPTYSVGRVTLLGGPTFRHINTLAPPAALTRSRQDNRRMTSAVVDNLSICEHCSAWAIGFTFFSYKRCLNKLTGLGGWY